MFSSNEDLSQNLTSKKNMRRWKLFLPIFQSHWWRLLSFHQLMMAPKIATHPFRAFFKTLHNEIWSRSRSEKNYFQTSKKFFWALKKKKKLWNIDRWFLLKAPPLTIFVRPFVLVFEKDYLGKIMKNILAQKQKLIFRIFLIITIAILSIWLFH